MSGRPRTVTVAQAAVRIARDPAAVLFPDTCALVDLVRLPARQRAEVVARTLAAALDVAAAAAEPRRLWVVVPPQVQEEWAEYAPREAEGLAAFWDGVSEGHAALHAGATAVGVAAPAAPAPSSFDALGSALVGLSERVLDRGLRLSMDADAESRATRRVYGRVAPGHRGGSLKDCVIADHALAVARLLGSEFGHPRVFFSSNTKDFCVSKTDPTPRPPLDEEFAEAGIELATTWEWSRAALGLV